jgi:hypothetical protein
MGLLEDYKEKNPNVNIQNAVNIEWVLQAIPVVSKTTDGLVPQLPNETTTTKYFRQDGTWQVIPETSATTLGLVKLNGNYTFTGIINVPTPDLPS